MRHPIRPPPNPLGLTAFDALAATLIVIALILIVAGMLGCYWHVAIDTWEGTASSDIDCHLNPAKATTPTNNHRAPRPITSTAPCQPSPAPAK